MNWREAPERVERAVCVGLALVAGLQLVTAFSSEPLRAALVAAAVVVLLLFVATAVHLTIPEPTGSFTVGRDQMLWADP